jgi:hypothetical protein
MSILIGTRNDGAYLISKKHLKVNVCKLRVAAYVTGMLRARLDLRDTVEVVPPGIRGCISHIYPMFEPGHQTPYHLVGSIRRRTK